MLLLAGSLFTARAYQWSAIVLLALACAPWRSLPANALSVLVGLYAAWLFVNAGFITPAYMAEAIYRPLIILGAFASVAALAREARIQIFRAGLALIALLVLLGLSQHFFGFWHFDDNPQRAAATFVTPNTFATAINLFLLPLSALYLLGRGTARVLILLLWLFAGLVASQSRGGMLAFVAGLAFVAACVGLPALWRERVKGLHLLVGLTTVWIVVVLAPRLTTLFGGFGGVAQTSSAGGFDITAGLSSATRLGLGAAERPEIYATTLGLIFQHPFAGAGASMFYPLFEMAKPHSLQNATYLFAHNDYLQHWLELGAPGLVLLVLLAAASLILALRASRRCAGDPLPLMCGAALASCFAHAMVDFPLVIPFILMVAGGYLGALAAHIEVGPLIGIASRALAGAGTAIPPAIRWVLALCALAWISQPVLADVAGQRAVAELFAGHPRNALYWQSVARRLEPRSAAQYWTEGVILRDQAVAMRDRALAAMADVIFTQGMHADPYQVSNYLERARTYRRHPDLFGETEVRKEALALTSGALRLRPHSDAVQAEHARTLVFAGRIAEARGIVEAMRTRNPDSGLARGLAAEFGMPAEKASTQ